MKYRNVNKPIYRNASESIEFSHPCNGGKKRSIPNALSKSNLIKI